MEELAEKKLPVDSPVKTPAAGKQLFDHKYTAAFVIVTGLFFLWAIPNNLNDVLIRQFMKSFQINRIQAGLVQSAFYLGYFFASIPAAMFLRKFGYKKGLIAGLLFYAVGSILFWPAAEGQSIQLLFVCSLYNCDWVSVSGNRRRLFHHANG
jgi:fucose permease